MQYKEKGNIREYIIKMFNLGMQLDRFGMSNCALGDAPVGKGDKFNLLQCPKNEFESS